MKARVYRSAQREFDCKIVEDGQIVRATGLGNLFKNDETVVVGDFVELEKTNEDSYTIISVYQRSSEIYRVIVREARKKVTAANCDVLIILTSVSLPEYKRGFIDRYLVRAEQWEVPAFVIFNKMDQYDPSKFDLKFEADRLVQLGVQSFETSAKDKNYQKQYLEKGMSELKEALRGKTALFVGQSGVGKSLCISALTDGKVELLTRAVGREGKGSHTTTWSEIIDCEDFLMIDSPGIRSFALDDMVGENLIAYFPDLSEIATRCAFAKCTHEENAQGCAFWKMFEKNDYQSMLLASRLESFLRISSEIKMPAWQKKV